MTARIDIEKSKILGTGVLEKTGLAYALVLLDAGHIDRILALENVALANLGEDEQHYLLKKDRAFFIRHFAAGGKVLGVVSEGRLIARSIVVNPTAAHPETGMADMETRLPAETLTILKGIVVDPPYRGNRLMDVMVRHWLAAAAHEGRTEALAEVAVGNTFSWAVFLKEGLHIESLGIDDTDHAALYNIHGHIPHMRAAFNKSARKRMSVPPADLARQKKLMAKGYKGVAFDRAAGKIIFARQKKKYKEPPLSAPKKRRGGFGLWP